MAPNRKSMSNKHADVRLDDGNLKLGMLPECSGIKNAIHELHLIPAEPWQRIGAPSQGCLFLLLDAVSGLLSTLPLQQTHHPLPPSDSWARGSTMGFPDF